MTTLLNIFPAQLQTTPINKTGASLFFLFKWCQIDISELNVFPFTLKAYISAVYIDICSFILKDPVNIHLNGIAHAFYSYIPEEIVWKVRRRLPEEFLLIVDEFAATFSF